MSTDTSEGAELERDDGEDGTAVRYKQDGETTLVAVDENDVVVQGYHPIAAAEAATEKWDDIELKQPDKGPIGKAIDEVKQLGRADSGAIETEDERTWTLVTDLGDYERTLGTDEGKSINADEKLGELFDAVAFGRTWTGDLGRFSNETTWLEDAGFSIPEGNRSPLDTGAGQGAEGDVRLVEKGDEIGEGVTVVHPKNHDGVDHGTGSTAIFVQLDDDTGVIHQSRAREALNDRVDEARDDLGLPASAARTTSESDKQSQDQETKLDGQQGASL